MLVYISTNVPSWSSGQDVALSRLNQGFDSPWGYHLPESLRFRLFYFNYALIDLRFEDLPCKSTSKTYVTKYCKCLIVNQTNASIPLGGTIFYQGEQAVRLFCLNKNTKQKARR